MSVRQEEKKKEVLDHILKCFPEFKMILNVNVTEKKN